MTVQTAVISRASSTEVVVFAERNLTATASFIALQSGRNKEAVESHLRWFLLENPRRKLYDPLGFGLHSDGRLVGCILCSPQAFRVGSQVVDFMGSSSFYVDQAFRGAGARLFLRYTRSSALLFGTSANAEAAALWKAAGAIPITFSEGELFGVFHWPPLVEEFAHRKYSNRPLTRSAASPISNLAKLFHPLRIPAVSPNSLRPLTSAEQVNDLLGNGLLSNGLLSNDSLRNDVAIEGLSLRSSGQTLTSVRDLGYIRWRYFSGHDETAAVFAFNSQLHPGEVLVTVNCRQRGYRGQINTLNVLDVYPEVDREELLTIIGALALRYRGLADAIVLRNQNPECRKSLCSRGFLWRGFDAPTAWFLDRTKRLPAHEWYAVPADGDALI
jgi:hypothetical protein